ncbi:hypothetical protein [Marinobacter sp.]|uniref:hypothetical protein n=1 Tax=Marinobacter sp. TaxID=50741 RepID=UPI003A8C90A7
METITVTNPWTGNDSEKPVTEVMTSIETFASVEECETVNAEFVGDTDKEWLESFAAIHGDNRLSEIAFS